VAQVARWQGREIYAFTRPGDRAGQTFARSLGVAWRAVGRGSAEPLDAAIIYATVGDLVPLALKAVKKGGRVVCAGIHMSDIPSFPTAFCGRAAARLRRQPHATGWLGLPRLAPQMKLDVKTTTYPLEKANEAWRTYD